VLTHVIIMTRKNYYIYYQWNAPGAYPQHRYCGMHGKWLVGCYSDNLIEPFSKKKHAQKALNRYKRNVINGGPQAEYKYGWSANARVISEAEIIAILL
jgi:hypothetical protein